MLFSNIGLEIAMQAAGASRMCLLKWKVFDKNVMVVGLNCSV